MHSTSSCKTGSFPEGAAVSQGIAFAFYCVRCGILENILFWGKLKEYSLIQFHFVGFVTILFAVGLHTELVLLNKG